MTNNVSTNDSNGPPKFGDRFDDWRRPVVDGLYLYCCPTCSALTDEPWAHEQWHERIGRRTGEGA